jgi:hypothetical protein
MVGSILLSWAFFGHGRRSCSINPILFPRVAVILGVGSLAAFLFVFSRLTRVTKVCVAELRHERAVGDACVNSRRTMSQLKSK